MSNISSEHKLFLETVSKLPNTNIIYGLCDPDTNIIRYIGKAKELYFRIRNHYKPSTLKSKTHKNDWIKSLLKDNKRVKVIVIEQCKSIDKLNESEIKWIKHYKDLGYNLTNGTNGGDGGKTSNNRKGIKFSEEHKKKLSDAKLGHIGYWNGKHRSDETKQKVAKASIGRIPPNKGVKMSDEEKAKRSIGNTGKRWKIVDGKRVWLVR